MKKSPPYTVGSYLAKRLEEIGANDYFTVPGDFNLVLLDEFLKNKKLRLVSCCNELNAGYAADGYARRKGIGVTVTTFCVGSLSQINAIAGAYAEDIPVIAISGGPNTNSEKDHEVVHHSLGGVPTGYVREMFAHVTASAIRVTDPKKAPAQIDEAILACLQLKKPVYIEVACNIANETCAAPQPLRLAKRPTQNKTKLEHVVKLVAAKLALAKKPMLVAGVKLRRSCADGAFLDFVDKSGYAFAMMPNAKGLVPETHKGYIGTYWGAISSPGVKEAVEFSDAVLFVGTTFTDYTTCGHTMLLSKEWLIRVDPDSVTVNGVTHEGIEMCQFLTALRHKVAFNSGSLDQFCQTYVKPELEKKIHSTKKLLRKHLFSQVESLLDESDVVIAETGDSWFNCLDLDLPKGCGFEIQMQFGSIGWSVGATLGAAIADHKKRRIVTFVGDGSFQLTAQEISTMVRYGLNPIIFVINNSGYTIEVEIHDGPYNQVQDWNYAQIMHVFNGKDGKGWSQRVATEGALADAIKIAHRNTGPSLIEVMLDPDDCSRELLEFGNFVAAHNKRPFVS